MFLRRIREGAYKILAIGEGNDCQVEVFLKELEEENPKESAKINARLDYVKDHGPPSNIQQCRPLKKWGGFEFKAGSVRITFFWDKGRMIICSMGFLKDGKKTFKPYLEKLKSDRQAYFAEKEREEKENESRKQQRA